MVLIGNSCDSAVCNDDGFQLFQRLSSTFPFLNIHFLRATKPNDGKNRLAFKAVFAMMKVYDLFPNKKYFFKIDDDTLVIPNRFFQYLSLLHTNSNDNNPLYFGTILNDHRPYPLCDGLLNPNGDGPVYGAAKQFANSTQICLAQGGAGYGMNNLAFKTFNNSTLCTMEMDLEYEDEDTYIAYRLYKDLRVRILHCGSFRPNWYNFETHWKSAITFHHVNNNWVNAFNVTKLIRNYSLI